MPSISNYVKLNEKNSGESIVEIIEPPKSDNTCRKVLIRYGLIMLAWVLVGSFLFYMTLVVKPSCHLNSSDEFWLRYKAQFGKNYTQEEDERRQCIFMANVKEMEIHNYLFQVGIESYGKEINMFSDFTPEELDAIKCFQGDMSSLPAAEAMSYRAEATYSESMDWRLKGAVGKVKNQGHCGSCYAFSATGALEAQHFLKTGQLVPLSEQNLVDCTGPQGNKGCSGGNMNNVFRYILQNNGIDTEQQYPYEGQEGSCRFNPSAVGATIKGYRSVAASEAALQAAVADIGPVAVGIHATSQFVHYGTGIFEDDSCSSYSLNHAVLVVGFGSEGGKDFWIVKNSWGSEWGENGYIRMARNMGNMCGIASMASYPVV